MKKDLRRMMAEIPGGCWLGDLGEDYMKYLTWEKDGKLMFIERDRRDAVPLDEVPEGRRPKWYVAMPYAEGSRGFGGHTPEQALARSAGSGRGWQGG
jgi:hypothetical protein